MTDFSQNKASRQMPLKNVGVALLFAVLLGPVGLLYATYWGGIVMIAVGFVVISSQYIVPIVLLWVVCCIWAVGAVNGYNKKLFNSPL